MLSFPNAKINLGLNITAKRTDGYHDIESCFYPIPFKDALEIIPSEKLSFESTGLNIPGDTANNLVLKAYNLLQAGFDIPSVQIILHKNIPMGAGLGGGSADGAFMLTLMNEYFKLGLTTEKLQKYALLLGSDCPFFIENQPKFVSGRGELFEKSSIDLSGYYLGLIFPNIHISTAEAYQGLKPSTPQISVKEVVENHPISDWKELLKNDFENVIFTRYPVLQQLKNSLYEQGAIYASMTGSGSTLYGLFKEKPLATFDAIVQL